MSPPTCVTCISMRSGSPAADAALFVRRLSDDRLAPVCDSCRRVFQESGTPLVTVPLDEGEDEWAVQEVISS